MKILDARDDLCAARVMQLKIKRNFFSLKTRCCFSTVVAHGFIPFLHTALFEKDMYFKGLRNLNFAILDFDFILNQGVTKRKNGRICLCRPQK
ncbi:MAG: hypothetical protein JNM12_13395 [Alphaproteobacteria bacterium]|nr:hypothetical protein [Alphaproteobacteria bacterium]